MSTVNTQNILFDGLLQLCRDNSAVNELIYPRIDEVHSLLTRYIAQIELFNPAWGLVGAKNHQELAVKHILDSLAPLPALLPLLQSANGRLPAVADAGSGAGLPGIPLAIALPRLQFTLIERMGRRTGFLLNTQAALELCNIVVEKEEVEKAKPGRFALVTFRAFRPLEPDIARALFRLCAPGGALAAYKGRREKAGEEIAALEKLRPDIAGRWELIPCPVPFLDEQRHLLVIRGSKPL